MTAHRPRPHPTTASPSRSLAASIIRHVVPPPDLRERARAFVDAFGTPRAREMLGGLSGETLARVVAGLPVLRGSIAIMAQALAARDAAAVARGEDGST